MDYCQSKQLRPKTMASYEQTLKLFARWMDTETAAPPPLIRFNTIAAAKPMPKKSAAQIMGFFKSLL